MCLPGGGCQLSGTGPTGTGIKASIASHAVSSDHVCQGRGLGGGGKGVAGAFSPDAYFCYFGFGSVTFRCCDQIFDNGDFKGDRFILAPGLGV